MSMPLRLAEEFHQQVRESACHQVLDMAKRNTVFYEKSGPLQKLPPFSGFIDASLHGCYLSMFVSRNDDAVALRVMWNHGYEPMTTKLWVESAKKAKKIADVGAHTGIYSLLAAIANPKASIISLEPSPVNFARLVLNVRENHIENVTPMYCAASDSRRNEVFGTKTQQWYLSTGGRLSPEKAVEWSIVKVVRLDHFEEFDLIKIDTEGGELKCLQGLGDSLKGNAEIFFECIERKTEIFDYLHKFGYKIFSIDDAEMTLTEVDTPISKYDPNTRNYLARK